MTTAQPIISHKNAARQPALQNGHDRKWSGGLRLAIMAGILLWLSCPAITLWPLAWVAVAPLIVSVTRARHIGQALWRGYVFGWVFLGPMWYWIGLTVVAWTGSNIGWLAWFGLTLILAGFYSAWSGAAWLLARRTTGGNRVLALAAAWVVMEWARTLGPLSMPWAQLSYTQYRFPLILQFADLTGAYGVSFLLMLVNGALAIWWMERDEPNRIRRLRGLFGAIVLFVFACFYGIARLTQPETGQPLTVAVMQGNFDNRSQPDMRLYADLTRDAVAASPGSSPALMVWSESASPGDALHDSFARQLFTDLSQTYQSAILVGSRVIERTNNVETNTSLLFLPGSETPLRYDKVQLVPFGEFIPFRSLFPPAMAQAFGFFPEDVKPGTAGNILQFTARNGKAVSLGPFICYESMFPSYARRMTQAGANLLVTQSNDAWFQSLAAMEQHLAAVVLRSIENRREVVRSTTTGITCFVDSDGRVTARAPRDKPAFLVTDARLKNETTLYTRFGDWFVALCGIGLLALPFAARTKQAPSL